MTQRSLWAAGAALALLLSGAAVWAGPATLTGSTVPGGMVLARSDNGAIAAFVMAKDDGTYTMSLNAGTYSIIADSQDDPPASITVADDDQVTQDFKGTELPSIDLGPDGLPTGSVWRLLVGGSPSDFGSDQFPTNNAGSIWYYGPADPVYKEAGNWIDATLPADVGLQTLGNGGQAGNGGYYWYRITVSVPAAWKSQNRAIVLDRYAVEDNDWAYVNGTPVGFSNVYLDFSPRRYQVPNDVINFGGDNVIAIRGNHGRGGSGMENAPYFPRLRVANQATGTVMVFLRDKSLSQAGPPPVDYTPAMNVPVTLIDSQGKTVATMLTDQPGYAWFQDLLPGQYSVKVDGSKGAASVTRDTQDVNVEALKSVVVEPQITLFDVAPGAVDPRDDDFAGTSLDSKWTSVDWGDSGGDVKVSNGVLSIAASGDFNTAADIGRFVYQKVSGDFVAAVKVLSSEFVATTVNGRGRAGLMVRVDDTDGAVNAMMHVAPYRRGTFFQWRDTAGATANNGGTGESYYETGVGAPVWVVLRRIGNNVAGFLSLDGKKASMVWQADIPDLPKDLLVGPAQSSNAPAGDVGTATFSNFTLRAPAAAAPAVTAGDLNGDAKVNVQDATLSLRIAVGVLTATDAQKAAGDVNGDGKLNVADTTLILRFAVGLLKTFAK